MILDFDLVGNVISVSQVRSAWLTELVSDQQLTLNIIIAANQAMSEDINSIYALLGAQKSGNSSKYFKFTFNSSEDDDLPN